MNQVKFTVGGAMEDEASRRFVSAFREYGLLGEMCIRDSRSILCGRV